MKAEHLLARASAVVAHRRGIYGAPDFLFQRMALDGPRCSARGHAGTGHLLKPLRRLRLLRLC